MPIASKLIYFQRRPSPAPPGPEPEPPDAHRRPCRDRRRHRSSLSSHHKPGQELVPGNQRDAAKSGGSTGNITEHVGGIVAGARLNRSISDHGRLPDAVQQARERLLQRLNSVDVSGRRQKTWPSETIWAGLTRPADLSASTSADNILASLTNCFQPGISTAATACRVEESTGGSFSDADKCTPVTLFPKPVPQLLQHSACREGAGEDREHAEPSAECSICLERCGIADGLIQLCCKHVFHSACLERWLQSRGDCPYHQIQRYITSPLLNHVTYIYLQYYVNHVTAYIYLQYYVFLTSTFKTTFSFSEVMVHQYSCHSAPCPASAISTHLMCFVALLVVTGCWYYDLWIR